jgi:hypothetical protein
MKRVLGVLFLISILSVVSYGLTDMTLSNSSTVVKYLELLPDGWTGVRAGKMLSLESKLADRELRSPAYVSLTIVSIKELIEVSLGYTQDKCVAGLLDVGVDKLDGKFGLKVPLAKVFALTIGVFYKRQLVEPYSTSYGVQASVAKKK